VTDWNTNILDEFRENEGKVGGMFEGASLLLLHHTGAKSGIERINPLMYQDLGGRLAIFASKAGATTHPDWYHNLLANPDTTIEVGTETNSVTARVADGDERQQIWDKQKNDRPQFAEYEKTAEGRQIPVIVLEPRQA
jgi:deazaflavin-dependent oxidoreductase (nitroreductase family)